MSKLGLEKALNGLQSAFYSVLHKSEYPNFQNYVRNRLQERGMDWQMTHQNLSRIPSSVPQAHRMVMFRFLLNGLATTRRLRFLPNVTVLPCPFCAVPQGDAQSHWSSCAVLTQAIDTVYGAGASQEAWSDQMLTLQLPMGGDQLQRTFACMFAVWRCRCIRIRGYNHFDVNDLAYHTSS